MCSSCRRLHCVMSKECRKRSRCSKHSFRSVMLQVSKILHYTEIRNHGKAEAKKLTFRARTNRSVHARYTSSFAALPMASPMCVAGVHTCTTPNSAPYCIGHMTSVLARSSEEPAQSGGNRRKQAFAEHAVGIGLFDTSHSQSQCPSLLQAPILHTPVCIDKQDLGLTALFCRSCSGGFHGNEAGRET